MTRQPTVDSRQLTAPPPTPATGAGGGSGFRRRRSGTALTVGAALAVAGAVAVALPTAAGAATVRLTAEEAAARAVGVSHVAAAAAARVGATQETVRSADAAALPSVAVAASVAQRSSVPEFAVPINGPLQPALVIAPDITTTYGSALRLQQALYAGGAITGLREAARHDAGASAATRAATVADLRLNAQLAYWEAVRAAASVEVARAQEERAARLLDDTEGLFQAGMAVRADVLAARERIASARVQSVTAQAQADNALAQLASLVQMGPGDTIELADSLAGPLPPPPPSARELQDHALAARPELAASAEQIAALAARRDVAAAQARPSVGAAAELDYARPNVRYFPQADQWKESWSVGVQASWTLFDGGKARADAAAVRLNQSAAGRDRDELTRQILLEVENDRRNLDSALAAVSAADAARASAVERETEAKERHAAGLAPMVDILDAESQLAAAEQQRVNARAGSWMAAAVLARAVGQ